MTRAPEKNVLRILFDITLIIEDDFILYLHDKDVDLHLE